MRRSSADRLGLVDVAHQAQRHAQHVADAERDGAHVHVGEVAVEQVGDDPRLAGAEHLLGNLAARRESAARERDAAAAARQLELELVAVLAASMMKPRSAPLTSMRRIEHQRQHVVEHAAGAERAQALEERRDLPQVADRRRGRSLRRPVPSAMQEDHLGAAAAAEPDAIAVDERAFGHLLAVDVGAVPRRLVAQDVTAVPLWTISA